METCYKNKLNIQILENSSPYVHPLAIKAVLESEQIFLLLKKINILMFFFVRWMKVIHQCFPFCFEVQGIHFHLLFAEWSTLLENKAVLPHFSTFGRPLGISC